MAATDFPAGHALTVKLWSKRIIREALKQTVAMKFMGTSSNSMIQVFEDTQKGAGDRVRVPLRMLLTGDGVDENTALEGSEESLVTYYDDLLINEIAHATRNKTTMAEQRVPWSIRSEGAAAIRDWYTERIDTWVANVLTGNTGQGNVLYTGQNATTAPTSATGNTRILYTGGHGSEASLSTTNTFNLSLIDAAVEQAKISTPTIRPVRVGSQEYYVAFLHPFQVTAMRTNTNTGQWLDIQKAAMTGGEVEDSPIFTGALGVHNGVVMHEWTRIPAAPTNSNVRRAVLCGAQAAAMAFGKGYSGEDAKYVEDSFDYGRQFGQSVQTISGLKKMVFNSIDFGTIVMASYAVQSTPT
jgi:N4-gp56 family major capsid protein